MMGSSQTMMPQDGPILEDDEPVIVDNLDDDDDTYRVNMTSTSPNLRQDGRL